MLPFGQQAGSPSTGVSSLSGRVTLDNAVAALTDRLRGMAFLREGTSRSDEDDELAQALMGVTIDPSAPPRPPSASLRGGGGSGGAFSLRGTVSQATTAPKIHGADDIAKRLATDSATTHVETNKAENANRRSGNPFSAQRGRISTVNRNEEESTSTDSRGGDTNLPTWRISGDGDSADAFRRSIGLGVRCGVGQNDTWGDADGKESTEDTPLGPPVSDCDKEPPAAIWEETMGEATEGFDGCADAASLEGGNVEAGDRPTAHIQTRILAKRDSVVNDQSKLMVLLHHVYDCQAAGNGDTCIVTAHCASLRRMWSHVRNCSSADCSVS